MRITRRTFVVLSSLLLVTVLAWQGIRSVSADTTVSVCGVVSAYTAAGAVTPGLITINGVTYPILAGVTLNGAGQLGPGSNVCLTLNLNNLGQITSGNFTANVTTSVNVCGVVSAFQAATANAPGSITIGGTTLPIAAGTTITGANQLTTNANACLSGTLNAQGQIIAPSTITLGATSTFNVCGVVNAYTAATANTPGSITIGGQTIPIAAGTVINGAGQIVVGNNICLSGTLNAQGQVIAPTSATVGATTSLNVCGVVTAYQAATANAPGSITIGGQTIPIAAGATITGNNLITLGSNLCLNATLNGAGQIIVPSSIGAQATTRLNICGVVTAYTAATANAPGSITIGGTVIPIAAGTVIENAGLITVGSDLCLSATLNAQGQIIPPSSVGFGGNVTLNVCGNVDAYTAATANTAGSITINGTTFPIAAGTTINGNNLITVGADLCFNLTVNASGQVIPPSTVIVDVSAAVTICGTVTAYTAATATTPGSITIGGVTLPIAAGATISGQGNITVGASLQLTAQLNVAGQITSQSSVTVSSCTGSGVCGTVTAYVAPTATASGSVTVGGVTILLLPGTALGNVTIGSQLCVNVPVICGTVTAYVAPTATTAGSITVNGVTITLAAGTTLGFQVVIGQNTCVNTSTTPLPTPTPTPTPTPIPTPTPRPGPGNAACPANICFRQPVYYCTHQIPFGTGSVRIPIGGLVTISPTRDGGIMSPTVARYMGCGFYSFEAQASAARRLTQLYIAAQVSIGIADARSPFNNLSDKTQLGCFIMPMAGMPSPIPVTLSNGVTINANTTFWGLFAQTEAAIRDMRTADIEALIKIYQSLGCGD